jgi:hypothetical protein
MKKKKGPSYRTKGHIEVKMHFFEKESFVAAF